MDTKTLFYLNSLRTQIAFKEVMRDWQPEIQAPMQCPFCQSEKVYKRMQSQDGNTHICGDCRENFSKEMLPGCRCLAPGHLMKCQDCPRFQAILPVLKEKVALLQGHSREELENLIGYCQLPNCLTLPTSVNASTSELKVVNIVPKIPDNFSRGTASASEKMH